MSSEPNRPETATLVEVEVTPETEALTDNGKAGPASEVKSETKALVDAIKKRAQTEAQSAGDFTRDTYLNAVRQAREAIEQHKIFDPDKIEESIQQIQQEAEKNWQSVVNEVTTLGDRLADAAKAAWTVLTAPKSEDNPDGKSEDNSDAPNPDNRG